jgi:hypothetical protein
VGYKVTSVIDNEDFVIVKTDDERLKIVVADAGRPGAAGQDGFSAYEVALNNGFVGTEQDWLNSLIGQPGNDGYTGLWYTGTGPPGTWFGTAGDMYLENVTGEVYAMYTQGTWSTLGVSILGPEGPTGPDGPEGVSAYQLAVSYGFMGTEEEWLASLVGAPGIQGPPGVPGGLIESASAPLFINSASVILLEYDAATLTVGPDGLTVIGGVGGDASTLDGFDSSYFLDTSSNTQTKAGDLNVSGQTATSSLDLADAQLSSDTFVVNAVTPRKIDEFFSATYRSAEYTFQFSQGSSYALVRVMLIHDGTNVAVAEYGHVSIGTDIEYYLDAAFVLTKLELTIQFPTANITPVGLKFSKVMYDA